MTGVGRCTRAAALALCLALAGAADARAGSAGGDIVVSAPHARAIVERHPFHLQIQDGRGRLALGEVANTGQAPQVEPPTVDPIPPGVTS